MLRKSYLLFENVSSDIFYLILVKTIEKFEVLSRILRKHKSEIFLFKFLLRNMLLWEYNK